MRSARLYSHQREFLMEELPIPSPGDDETVVKVMAAGLCASDLHILDGENMLEAYPRTLGHEVSGVVTRPGKHSRRTAGDRVCVNFLVTCGECRYCGSGRESLCLKRQGIGVHRDGGFAEFVCVPDKNLIDIPEDVPFSHAALATDALATPYHAISKRANVNRGDPVGVIGLGGLGLNAVRILKMLGADPIVGIDIDSASRDRALRAGATVVVDPREAEGNGSAGAGGEGLRTVFDFVGAPQTVSQASEMLERGGRVVIVGHSSLRIQGSTGSTFSREELEIVGSYAFERAEIEELLDHMAAGRLDIADSITHTLPLQRINEAVHELRTRRTSPSRIVITPSGMDELEREEVSARDHFQSQI